MKTNDTQNNAQHPERAPGSAAPRHQHPAHPCVCWWRRGAVSLQSESGEGRALTGEGTAGNPYKIATADDLLEFADKVNNQDQTSAWAELTADIDLNSQPWYPIGSEDHLYTGTFDGNGHTISGLTINNSRANYQGLFGYVSGIVQNLSVSGSVSGNNYVGGIVGYNLFGTVTNCAFSGSVSGSDHVGGVVGENSGSVINSYNTGNISGGNRVGGVVGYNGGNVENCYNTGAVNSSGDNVGGVVGQNFGGVENCYNTGKVTGSSDYSYIGGVVGYNSSFGNVTGCYFLKTDDVNSNLQGIGNDRAEGTESLTADQFKKQNSFTDWDFGIADTDTWSIHPVLGRPVLNENKEGGDGLPDSPYEISTADELKNFAVAVNTGSEQSPHAKLMNNIDLEGSETNQWTPIGTSISNSYTGTFDGNGKTISGLYINNSTADYKGLFGFVGSEGTVQNLTVDGTVSGSNSVGGVVGYNSSGTVTNCAFSGSVSGRYYVGGVVGRNSGTYGSVTNCYNTGEVTGSTSGGVVGYNQSGTVENCYNTGKVSGNRYVGGVVGSNSGTVENCYTTGTVTVTGTDNYVGGVVGLNRGIVTNCYNTGTVSGSGGHVDGVVGDNRGTVKNCYYQIDKGAIVGIGGTTADDTTTVAKTAAEFQSGEVAYLLEQNISDDKKPVWGQSKLNTSDSLPTLVALNPDAAKKVYQLTFDWSYGGAPEGTTTTTNVYTNGSVTIPEINHDRTGYHISGWKDKNEQPVTAGTTVGEDADFTAEWTANTYTITVTAGSGGTVSGGGNVTHGDSVEVTATANQGYHFVNWTENGTEVSTEATFTFNATVDRNLIAIFAKNEEPEPTPTPTPTPDPEPSGPSTGDSTGWDDIRDELENAEKGDEITIDMGDETKVPAEIFESLAGKDVDVTFDLGDIQWTVNGADIPTDTDFTDLDLGVNLDTSGIPVNVINTITGEVGTVQITLAHDGEFGFTMTLTAPLGKENAGYWANLYHYDEDAEALNFEAAAKIDETGSVTIPFSHASQYAIVIDTLSHATVDVSDLFSDIAPDAWYKDAIQYAYDNGLMTGVSATEFAPEQTTTRAMIVSILARLENVTTAEAAGFADVDDNEWYATAVNWAANVGVVNGYEDNTFKPNTAITREQLAAILMNYAAYKGEDVSNRADLANYTDQPSTWANEAMQWAVAEGLISGVTADTLQPQGAATRAQVAAILQRFLSE